MSLYRRGNVYWSVYYIGGSRRMVSTKTGNRKLAEKIEQQLRDEDVARMHGLPEERPELTVSMLWAEFCEKSVVKAHHTDRMGHLLPFFGNARLADVSKGLVSTYRKLRQQEDGVAPATTNRDVSVLRRLLNFAVEENLLAANPLSRLRMERERRTSRPVLSVAEEDALLAAAPEHLRHLVIAALDSGLRRGELLHQRWGDVDLERRVLFVSKSKTPEGEARAVPLTVRLDALLRALPRNSDLVFTYEGRPLRSLRRSWKTAVKASGIRPLRFHDLRHCFSSRLMEAGVLIEIRCALMGHSTGTNTNLIYTHIELPTKRKAIAALEAWTGEQRASLAGQSKGKEESHSATSQSTDAHRPGSEA